MFRSLEVTVGEDDDPEDPADEWVAVTNHWHDVDLSDFVVETPDGDQFRFPDGYVLPAGQTVRVRTGQGEDLPTDLYWGRDEHAWSGDAEPVVRSLTRKPIVFLVHGWNSGPHIWDTLAQMLTSRGYQILRADLRNTHRPIGEITGSFNEQVNRLAPSGQFNIVAHSMGGLVGRNYVQNYDAGRVNNMVMLGTPNHGTSLAQGARPASHSASQMIPNSDFLNNLNSQQFPQHINCMTVAGTSPWMTAWLFLLNRPHDGVVEAESVQFPGAQRHEEIDCNHIQLPQNNEAAQRVIDFLNNHQ